MADHRVMRRGPAWDDAYAEALRNPQGLLARADTVMFKKRDAGRTVGLVAIGEAHLVLKRYEERGVVERIERLIAGSPAARAARGIDRMRGAGFDAPELVAVLEGSADSLLVTRKVGGERADEAFAALEPPERLRFAAELGGWVRSLHERGVYPQDLWMTNLVAVPRGSAWAWVLVDLDRVRVYRRLAWKRRLKNLVQIERSLGRVAGSQERARFLESYLATTDREELRRVGEEIVAAGRRKDAGRGVVRE